MHGEGNGGKIAALAMVTHDKGNGGASHRQKRQQQGGGQEEKGEKKEETQQSPLREANVQWQRQRGGDMMANDG